MKVAPGIYQILIPIPFPLRFVNCYLIRGHKGLTVLDTGLQHHACLAAWEEAFSLVQTEPEQIEKIVVTHLHPDHIGLGGWLQQRSGAPVYLLDKEAEHMAEIWSPAHGQAQLNWFHDHGVPEELCSQMQAQHEQARRWISPWPTDIRKVSDGDRLSLGDREFRVIWSPGHCDGQMLLYDREDEILFTGDQVLPTISPNVSAFPNSDPNPLGSFIGALLAIRQLPTRLVLPGHGDPFCNVTERVDDLLTHHQKRLEDVRRLVRGGASAWDVAMGLFGTDLSVSQVRFAVGEAIAHLEYLVGTGELVQRLGEPIRYAFS